MPSPFGCMISGNCTTDVSRETQRMPTPQNSGKAPNLKPAQQHPGVGEMEKWRKRTGVEPAKDCKAAPSGFEGQPHHRMRAPSLGICPKAADSRRKCRSISLSEHRSDASNAVIQPRRRRSRSGRRRDVQNAHGGPAGRAADRLASASRPAGRRTPGFGWPPCARCRSGRGRRRR
jgi:hypothetical protein